MIKFNNWEVIDCSEKKYWQCKCTLCGSERKVVGADVRSGRSKSCGCTRSANMAQAAKDKNTTHGRSDKTEQIIWSDMKRRCYSKNRPDYQRYGARGIKVCERWLVGDGVNSGLYCFIQDMGMRPSRNHTLDRLDNDGDYTKDNCRWATREEQNYNKRNTFKFFAFGKEFTLSEASKAYGIKEGTIYQRITKYKMTGDEALTK